MASPSVAGHKNVRVFYYLLLGAFGGLLGWYLIAGIESARGAALPIVLKGMVYGALIGFCAGSFDGLSSRSFRRIVRFGSVSLGLGLVVGAIALSSASSLYGWLLGGAEEIPKGRVFLAGTVCWVLFGGVIGLGEGIGKGSQAWKGLLGGMIGGAIGGVVYEIVGRGAPITPAGMAMQGLTFTTLGGSIGASVALVTTILQNAWVEITSGKLAGSQVNLSKYVHPGSTRAAIIGSSDWRANIYLPGDGDVLPEHATIGLVNGTPTLTVRPEASAARSQVTINNRPVSSWPLQDGDTVRIGSTTLTYRHKKQAMFSSKPPGDV